MLVIHNTDILKEALTYSELNDLKEKFKLWKSSNESTFYYFGKDGAYHTPKLAVGELRHVHIIPINEEELEKWDFRWNNENKSRDPESRKVSNRALVYAENKQRDYLLITILEDAHKIAHDKNYLSLLGEIAENFIIYNHIDA